MTLKSHAVSNSLYSESLMTDFKNAILLAQLFRSHEQQFSINRRSVLPVKTSIKALAGLARIISGFCFTRSS